LSTRKLTVPAEANSPKPKLLPLTDILLDAWSMTSIRDKLPGRPVVDPWLRGIQENETQQTTVAWRVELDRLGDKQKKDALIQAMEDYPLKPREVLRERTDVIVKALAMLPDELKTKSALIIGVEFELRTLGELAARNRDGLIRELSEKTLVLPASIGGIKDGLFTGNWEIDGSRPMEADVADIEDDLPQRRRRVWCVKEGHGVDLDAPPQVVGSPDEFKSIAKDLAMRYIDSTVLAVNGDGEPTEWFAYFAAELEGNRNWNRVKQSLSKHVGDVVRQAGLSSRGLSMDAVSSEAIEIAAKYHDTGKGRDLWQAYARRGPDDPPLGKSDRYLDWRVLCFDKNDSDAVFRHEFGSLVDGTSNPEITGHTHRELILHLIASHHGHARPHFGNSIDPGPTGDADPDAIAAAVPVRFANLQRRYGRWGLAWLEAIFRCADQRASAEAGNLEEGTE
jgi:CRISPR-associated endonuclease/helicase Cas3